MSKIPSYAEWMKKTGAQGLKGRKRSEYLEKLDEAIKKNGPGASPAGRKEIKDALDRWRFDQSRQGKDWRKSMRNRTGTVTELYRAVNADRRTLKPEELEAMKYIARAQAMALQKQFDGKQLKFKSSTLVGMATEAGSSYQRFKTGASGAVSGGKLIKSSMKTGQSLQKGIKLVSAGKAGFSPHGSGGNGPIKQNLVKMCQKMCPGVDANKVFATLKLGGVDQFATEVAPFVGAISSGGKAIVEWIRVIERDFKRSSSERSRFAFAPEDPEAALDAVLELLKREQMALAAQASVHTAAFTGKTLGVFADGGAVTGPVIGALESLASIMQTVIEYVRDYKEVESANGLLKVGALNLELFGVSPILGCYFLVVQDHSTIINMAVGDYGTPNFVFDAERLVGKVRPVLDEAHKFIHSSRYEIPGMEKAKGVAKETFAHKKGLAKVGALPGHITESIDQKIEGWLGNPVKPPPVVNPSRIQGIGWRGHEG